jgi:hypothetical protein
MSFSETSLAGLHGQEDYFTGVNLDAVQGC